MFQTPLFHAEIGVLDCSFRWTVGPLLWTLGAQLSTFSSRKGRAAPSRSQQTWPSTGALSRKPCISLYTNVSADSFVSDVLEQLNRSGAQPLPAFVAAAHLPMPCVNALHRPPSDDIWLTTALKEYPDAAIFHATPLEDRGNHRWSIPTYLPTYLVKW